VVKLANSEAFTCDECGDGVILWDGMNEEIVEGYIDFCNITQIHQIDILPGGFCYSCHLLVN
jgi:hypothetical protein